MKSFFGFLLFLIVFTLAGVAMHYYIYSKPGLFIWSLSDEGGVVQTKLKPALAPVAPATEDPQPETDPATESTATKEPVITKVDIPETKLVEEKPKPPVDPNIVPLFNETDLGNWEITQYGGEGDVFVTDDKELEFGFGAILTGVHWKEEVPQKSNYEISLDAMKLDGTDFFCALTFPVNESHATLVIGGWGGGIVGISSVDDLDASENETMVIEGFNDEVWYKVRVRVTDEKIEAWIDDDKKIDLELKDKKISLRPGDIELSVPIGIASFQTRSKYRNIIWKNLPVAK